MMLDNQPRGTIVIEDLEVGMMRYLQKQVTDRDIEQSPGLREVAEILFGADEADRRLAEYFGGDDNVPPAVKAGPRPTEATKSAGDTLVSPR